jgi:4-hydroxy-tetrahydrodipicolinate synthase
LRLANDFENIVAVKEASGDMDQIMKILKDKPANFVVLSGDDGLTLPMIHMGAEGVISVIGQSHPKEYSDMVSFGMSGNKKIANQLHYKLYDYYGPLYAEGNPAGVKACLELLGICKAVVRPPLVGASDAIKKEIKSLLM